MELPCYGAALEQPSAVLCQSLPVPPAGAVWNSHAVRKGYLPPLRLRVGCCCHRMMRQCVSINSEQTNIERVRLGHTRVHINFYFNCHLMVGIELPFLENMPMISGHTIIIIINYLFIFYENQGFHYVEYFTCSLLDFFVLIPIYISKFSLRKSVNFMK